MIDFEALEEKVRQAVEPAWLKNQRLHALTQLQKSRDISKKLVQAVNGSIKRRPTQIDNASLQWGKEMRKDGVLVGDLRKFVEDKRIRSCLEQTSSALQSAEISAACSLWQGGMAIIVPKDLVMHTPVQVFRQLEADPFHRVVVVCEQGASLTLIDGCVSPAMRSPRAHFGFLEVWMQPTSTLKLFDLESVVGPGDYYGGTKQIHVQEASLLEWDAVQVGPREDFKEAKSVLVDGEGAFVIVQTLTDASDSVSAVTVKNPANYTLASLEQIAVNKDGQERFLENMPPEFAVELRAVLS